MKGKEIIKITKKIEGIKGVKKKMIVGTFLEKDNLIVVTRIKKDKESMEKLIKKRIKGGRAKPLIKVVSATDFIE